MLFNIFPGKFWVIETVLTKHDQPQSPIRESEHENTNDISISRLIMSLGLQLLFVNFVTADSKGFIRFAYEHHFQCRPRYFVENTVHYCKAKWR